MNLNNLYCLFLLSLFTAVAGNWKPGTGDCILLPSSDFPITSDANAFNPANGYRVNSSDANTRDYLANISTTHPMFKNKFLLFGDSLLFEVVGACDNSSASCVTFLTNRTASDNYFASPDQIEDLAFKLSTVGVRDAVIVLTFGFDDIRFNINTELCDIAIFIDTALQTLARKLQSKNVQIWFLTIPEIGDLAPKFREFNDFFRETFNRRGMPYATVLDFSKIALSNESANVSQRFSMLMSFFEQKLNTQLLTPNARPTSLTLKNPYKFVVANIDSNLQTTTVKFDFLLKFFVVNSVFTNVLIIGVLSRHFG